MKEYIATIVVAMLSFICTLISFYYYVDLSNQYVTDKKYAFVCMKRYEHQGLPSEEYFKGTYYIEDNQIAEEKSIQKKVSTSLIIIDFSLNDMFGVGVELLEYDTNGCIISSSLADELFGSQDVNGLSVFVMKKNYSIRAVFPADDKMIIVQQDNKKDGAWGSVSDAEISGVIINVSEEVYKGQNIDAICTNYGIDKGNYYYISDYLNMIPGCVLPVKLSDFEKWSTMMEEWKKIWDRQTYHREDVIETFYYRLGNKLQGYRLISLIFAVLFLISCIKCIFIYRKRNGKKL